MTASCKRLASACGNWRMSERVSVVTIDGPAGVGKSTVSRQVAAALGYAYLDTGAMYRAVAVYLSREGIDGTDLSELREVLQQLRLELLPAAGDSGETGISLAGEDISGLLRSPEVSMAASRLSALAPVREKLSGMQRQLGGQGKIVAEGRDMGTVVFPEAKYKFFLDARPEERARRRTLQLQAKGEPADAEEILRQTLERDHNDRHRALAPLCPAATAVVIDTSDIDSSEVVRRILSYISGAGNE